MRFDVQLGRLGRFVLRLCGIAHVPYVLDRYLLVTFAKVLAITFVSLTGLYIVIHAFSNFGEFYEYGEQEGNPAAVLFDYYGPHVLRFFDQMGAVMALLAAVFVIAWLLSTNELTAIVAGGVSKGRVVAPLIVAAAFVSLIGVMNRELWIPQVRDKLIRHVKDWRGDKERTLKPTYDYRTDIFIGGRHTVTRERKVLRPIFRLPPSMHEFATQVAADAAVYQPATAEHPAGYLLENVSAPADLASLPMVKFEGEPLIYTPREAAWLGPKECFIASDVSFEQLVGGAQWRTLGSTREILRNLRNPSLNLGNDTMVTLHARLVQPLLDVTLFVLGLPIVLAQRNRNLFVSACYCLALIGVFFLTVLTCHTLGSNYMLAPALSAWLPLLIFTPVAYATALPLWR